MKKDKKISYAPITTEDVVWVCSSYSHLVEIGETITGDEYARRIREVYDCETSNKNNLAAFFAQFGVETIGKSKMRDERKRVTWHAIKDVWSRMCGFARTVSSTKN